VGRRAHRARGWRSCTMPSRRPGDPACTALPCAGARGRAPRLHCFALAPRIRSWVVAPRRGRRLRVGALATLRVRLRLGGWRAPNPLMRGGNRLQSRRRSPSRWANALLVVGVLRARPWANRPRALTQPVLARRLTDERLGRIRRLGGGETPGGARPAACPQRSIAAPGPACTPAEPAEEADPEDVENDGDEQAHHVSEDS